MLRVSHRVSFGVRATTTVRIDPKVGAGEKTSSRQRYPTDLEELAGLPIDAGRLAA
jgi:hypothetical protein